jgi:integrase
MSGMWKRGMVRIMRHRQTKEPDTDRPNLNHRATSRLYPLSKLADPNEYGGHSLRAGFVTEASANGATDREIMKQTGHKSSAMVHRYAREDQKDRQTAVGKLGL